MLYPQGIMNVYPLAKIHLATETGLKLAYQLVIDFIQEKNVLVCREKGQVMNTDKLYQFYRHYKNDVNKRYPK